MFPSHPPRFVSPSVPPAVWSLRAIHATDGSLTVWEFLTEPEPHQHHERELHAVVGNFPVRPHEQRPEECRPWLVISERVGLLGVERFAVPRLMPSCEWANEAAANAWHEAAFRGEATPISTRQTIIDARAAQPSRSGRPANQQSVLSTRVATVCACDLERRIPAAIAADRQLDYSKTNTTQNWHENAERRRKTYEAARQSVYRDLKEGRKLLAQLGGLPWAAFPDGKLTDRWWQTEGFAAALEVWYGHAYQLALAYRDGWERPVGTLSPAQHVVYVLLRLRDRHQLPPTTLALAQAHLEDDARASDAHSHIEWVAGLLLAASPGFRFDPEQFARCHPVLQEAWSRAHAAGEDS